MCNLQPKCPGLPPIDTILGLTWDEAIYVWPRLKEQVSLVKTGPPKTPKFYHPGPWRVVAVEVAPCGTDGLWQVVLAREYW